MPLSVKMLKDNANIALKERYGDKQEIKDTQADADTEARLKWGVTKQLFAMLFVSCNKDVKTSKETSLQAQKMHEEVKEVRRKLMRPSLKEAKRALESFESINRDTQRQRRVVVFGKEKRRKTLGALIAGLKANPGTRNRLGHEHYGIALSQRMRRFGLLDTDEALSEFIAKVQ